MKTISGERLGRAESCRGEEQQRPRHGAHCSEFFLVVVVTFIEWLTKVLAHSRGRNDDVFEANSSQSLC